MGRYSPPFNGNRYILNKATGEIHDLDNESERCQIDKMNSGNILNCASYEDSWLRAKLLGCPAPNGCHYCLPLKDNG